MHDVGTNRSNPKLKNEMNEYTLEIHSGRLGVGLLDAEAMTCALRLSCVQEEVTYVSTRYYQRTTKKHRNKTAT